MLELYEHQVEMVDAARNFLRSYQSVLIQAITGTGKTAMATKMMDTCQSKNKVGFFVCHRAELVDQTAKTFNKADIPYSFISAGLRSDLSQPIQICSIDTLKNKLGKIPTPDLVIWDEAHHISANGWANTKQYFSRAKHIGLSATPERLDGRGLGEQFDRMVQGPSMLWLMDNGYLSYYDYLAPSTPDMSNVHTYMGDFKKGEAQAVMEGSKIVGDIVSHYLKHARGKRALGFAVSVEHSKHLAEAFRQAGIRAIHLDGNTKSIDRKAAAQALAKGDLEVIFNVDLFGEGYDLSAQAEMPVTIDAVILARPTQSLSLYLQWVGRCLRTKADGSRAVILDHAGNVFRHGLPDMEREWTLEGREKGKRRKKLDPDDIAVKQCTACYAVHPAGPMCTFCGHVYKIMQRKIETEEGELEKVDADKVREQMRQAQSQSKTVDDMIENLGYSRGRAEQIVQAREAKRLLRVQLFNLWKAAHVAKIVSSGPRISEINKLKPKQLKEQIEEFNQLITV